MGKLYKFLILSSIFIVATTSISTEELGEPERWIQTYNARKKAPDATLHFYVQDALTRPNATVWEVARASITSKSSTDFGQVRVMDDLITFGPDPGSEKLGRAQGMITSSDLEVDAMVINIVFMFNQGPYSGASLSVLGRSQIFNKTRELVITGGTGVFRMARGYAIATTNNYSTAGSQVTYAILEYKVYLYHPSC